MADSKKPAQDPPNVDNPRSFLAQEHETWHNRLADQPLLVQRFLEAQARKLADAIIQRQPQARFTLPDKVVLAGKTLTAEPASGHRHREVHVPAAEREQMAGGLIDRLTKADINYLLRVRLDELETSPNAAVAASAGLIRFTTAQFMVHNMLPSGRTVTYHIAEGEEIPSIPALGDLEPASAITASSDAIVEREDAQGEAGRGELLVPYVEAARRFYLPQWVAFDENDRLVVNSVNEAEAHIASMQRYLGILHASVTLAPYIVVDEVYQQKRYGILGQLVNQGRALARYQTREIIRLIKRRASASDLNRGLSLSLPYFDDQILQLKTHNFVIIPAGRIMFVPAFVVRAVLQEQVKIAQDTRLSPSTRKHLLNEMAMLEESFEEED